MTSPDQNQPNTTGPAKKPLVARLLLALSGHNWSVGRSARRKLARRMKQDSLADFHARLAQLKPGDVCLDLGANMGTYTEKLAATGAEVHAYEPDPYCFAALQTRFAGRPNVHLHNQAVSGSAGSFVLRRAKGFDQDPDMLSQSSSIAIRDDKLFDESNSVIVETVAFADVVKGLQRPVALVKMDIEGAEFSILDTILADEAAGRPPLPIKVLYMETHERNMPTRFAMLKALRVRNWAGALPYPIDTFWP